VVRGGGRETRRGWEKLGEGGRNSEELGEGEPHGQVVGVVGGIKIYLEIIC